MTARRPPTGFTAALLIFATIGGFAGDARALEIDANLHVRGHIQLWATLYEQMERVAGLRQHPSGDPAATWTTGFSFSRVRVGADLRLLDDRVRLVAQLRLEEQPGLLDAYVAAEIAPWLIIAFGQMKIPGPRETLTGSRDLDFVLRSQIAETIPDYSLSRTTYASSLFFAVRSYQRDLGLALRGRVPFGYGEVRYRLMVGNGLGNGLFIGGTQSEFILTNMGQLYWGGRVEVAEILDVVSVGGHFSYNQHDNMVFQSGRVVFDLRRMSYSGDLRIEIPGTGARLTALYGGGVIDDDYDNDGRTDLAYSGFACGVVWRLTDPIEDSLADWGLDDHRLEIGTRYDSFFSEWNESGVAVEEHRWTVGLSYLFLDLIKVQLNYVNKLTRDPSFPDLDDDILLLNLQAAI